MITLQTLFRVVLLSLSCGTRAFADASILIWPIDPVIEHEQTSSSLWLENKGHTVARLQIRVLGWDQAAGSDRLTAQSHVLASPPAAEIAPRQRQLVRLVRTTPVAAGREQAFRVLVDEIPGAGDANEQNAPGLKFQLRYSVPLFVSGEGVWTRQNYRAPRNMREASQPQLGFQVLDQGGQRWLVVRNSGAVHARLSTVQYRAGERVLWDCPGLLGYVLPGAQVRWAVPDDLPDSGTLLARVNTDLHVRAIQAQ